MGRRVAARLHRVPDGLVARPQVVRRHVRPAGRAAPELGDGATWIDLAVPAATMRWTGCSAGWTHCPDELAAEESASGPKASRSMPSRPCRCCSTRVPCDMGDRPSSSPALSMSSTFPRPARLERPEEEGAAPRRRRPRQDVHEGLTRVTGRPEADLDGCSSCGRSGRKIADRPALARARPVRFPPVARPEGGLRHAFQARSKGPASRGGADPMGPG